MSNNTITVINRTGCAVFAGIDNLALDLNHPTASSFSGSQGSTLLQPGGSHKFVLSGNATANNNPFKVGYLTCYSGSLPGGYHAPYTGVILYNVYPGSLVTLATEVGTRGDSPDGPG